MMVNKLKKKSSVAMMVGVVPGIWLHSFDGNDTMPCRAVLSELRDNATSQAFVDDELLKCREKKMTWLKRDDNRILPQNARSSEGSTITSVLLTLLVPLFLSMYRRSSTSWPPPDR